MRSLLFLSLLSLGCAKGTASTAVPGELATTGKTVVTVNGNAITQDVMDAMLEQMPAQMRQQLEMTGQMGQLQEQLVMGELLYREALKRELHTDTKVKTTIALATRSALAQGLIEAVVKERTTDEKVQAHYNDHKVQYARPQVKASHILVKEEALINEIKTKLDAGEDFAALAKAHSMDPGSKNDGGSLGWFKKADMVGPFGDAAFEAEKGTVTAPVKTRFGFHIIMVEDKREEIPLDEVREQIEGQLGNELAQAYLEELKSGATIVEAGKEAAPAAEEAPAAEKAPAAEEAKPTEEAAKQ
jgi:peptidyl-prolyl cis-trans isomerase C